LPNPCHYQDYDRSMLYALDATRSASRLRISKMGQTGHGYAERKGSYFFFSFFTLVTGPSRPLGLKLTNGFMHGDRLRSGRGAARAEDAQGTPTKSHISPSILVYEEKNFHWEAAREADLDGHSMEALEVEERLDVPVPRRARI